MRRGSGCAREGLQLLAIQHAIPPLVNLREWALAQGIHPQTAYRW
jgi:hypothetical protein